MAFAVLAVLLPICLWLGWNSNSTDPADEQLQEAIAEADQLDPGWRLDELEAKRAVLDDADNAAQQVLAARRWLPNRWPTPPAPVFPANPDLTLGPAGQPAPPFPAASVSTARTLDEQLADLPAQVQLNDAQARGLRAELDKVARALTEAHKLADLPNGRYAVTWSRDYVGTMLPHVDHARVVALLLRFDATLRAHDGDADQALASGRAILNTGRSMGDEPGTIAQLVRIACRALAVASIERTLAQGQPSEAALDALQQLLHDEAAHPLLWIAARGERAGLDHLMQAVLAGEVKLSHFTRDSGLSFLEALALYTPGEIKTQRAALLRHLTQLVEAARLPVEQQVRRLEQLQATVKEQPPLVRLFTPALEKVAAACQRSQALMHCAIVAVAAERYRRAYQSWPDALAALQTAGFLAKLPADPFNGASLRLGRLGDGIVIYSLGPDGKDDGGKLDRRARPPAGADVGLRLWDVPARRQPPLDKGPGPPAPERPGGPAPRNAVQ
jgi:hypothetical protein